MFLSCLSVFLRHFKPLLDGDVSRLEDQNITHFLILREQEECTSGFTWLKNYVVSWVCVNPTASSRLEGSKYCLYCCSCLIAMLKSESIVYLSSALSHVPVGRVLKQSLQVSWLRTATQFRAYLRKTAAKGRGVKPTWLNSSLGLLMNRGEWKVRGKSQQASLCTA